MGAWGAGGLGQHGNLGFAGSFLEHNSARTLCLTFWGLMPRIAENCIQLCVPYRASGCRAYGQDERVHQLDLIVSSSIQGDPDIDPNIL